MTNTKKSEYKVAQEWRESGRWFIVYRLMHPHMPDDRDNRVIRYACRSKRIATLVAAVINREAGHGKTE